jgi:3',5'-cyclic AMP phosphodiesterase CpdA
MRLVHLTDPHLTVPGGSAVRSVKRLSGYLSWRRRRQFVHRRDLLDQITRAGHDEQPDRILLTGDLAQIGLRREIAGARLWLQQLGPPARVQLVPGNHDIYARDSWEAAAVHWRDYLNPDHPGEADFFATFPRVVEQRANGVLLRSIGLWSAVPTAPFLARGRLGSDQRRRLAACEPQPQAFTCVLLHHPPLPGMIRWRKALADADETGTVLEELQPQLILHGHTHRNAVQLINQTTIVAGTASASAQAEDPARQAAYRMFDIDQEGDYWRVEMRLKGIDPRSGKCVVREHIRWQLPQAGQRPRS